MLKYAKIINSETKKCEVGLGTNENFYLTLGMEKMEVDRAYNGDWYLSGYVPPVPEKSYQEKRRSEYPELSEQMDMIYWDKINGTNHWQEKISEIKAKYPKE